MLNVQTNRPRPTLNDVGKEAGVSRQTVSNVLNARHLVHPSTSSRVEQAIERLGYRPHAMARNLKTRSSRLLGYRVSAAPAGSSSLLMDRFMHALTDAARANGYNVLLFVPGEDEDEIAAHEQVIAAGLVDGLVLTDTAANDERVLFLAERSVPFVTFGRTRLNVSHSWVDVDNVMGTRRAIERVLAYGHRRIAFVGEPDDLLFAAERARGYREALQRNGVEPDERWDVRGPNEVSTGFQAQRALSDVGEGPTAFVCGSDVIAAGVLEAARTAGLRVGPRDLAVVGFDDSALAPLLTPRLTSVRQPLERVAEEIVRLVIAGLRGEPRRGVMVTPDLVVRDSG